MDDRETGLLAALALASLLACSSEAEPPYYMFPELEYELVAVPGARSGSEWAAGPEIPLHEVGRIGVVRVWADTLVGVFDAFACQVHLLRLRGDEAVEPLSRFGRCGDGPGELRGVSDLYLDGDTLIVAEHVRNVLTLFSTTHGGSRSLPLEPVREDSWQVMDILLASEGEITVNGTLSASSRATYGHVRRLARDDGRRLADALSEPPGALVNPAPILRRIFVCGDRDSRRLVVANRWRVERATLSDALEVAVGPFRSEPEWVAESPYDDRPGVRPDAFVRVACGAGQALLQWRILAAGNLIDRYYLEILDMDGRVLYQEEGGAPSFDHPSSHAVAGAVGNGWMTYNNDADQGPALRVFRLR